MAWRDRFGRWCRVGTCVGLLAGVLVLVVPGGAGFASSVALNPYAGTALAVSPTSLVLSSFAGTATRGSINGYGQAAQFNFPNEDAALNGSIYVGDVGYLRKVNAVTGQVTTLDGGGPGCQDSTNPSQVGFATSHRMDTDGQYLYDFENCNSNTSWWIRRIDPVSGSVATLAQVPDTENSSGYPELTLGADNAFYVTSGFKVIRVDGSTYQQSTYVDISNFTYNGFVMSGLYAIAADSTNVYLGTAIWNPVSGASEEALFTVPVGVQNPTATLLGTPSQNYSFGGGHSSNLVSAGPNALYFNFCNYVGEINKSNGAESTLIASSGNYFQAGAGSNAHLYCSYGLTSDGNSLWETDSNYGDARLARITAGPTGAPVTSANLDGGGNPSTPCSCVAHLPNQSGSRPVDDQTGDFWHTFNDLPVPGRGLPLNLTRTYNSDTSIMNAGGLFGPGWSFSYGMSLSVNGTVVTISQENGSQVAFNQNGSTYTPARSDILASLAHNQDGSWTFTRRSTITFTFNSSGQLTAEKDLNGYATTVSYPSGSQIVITDPAGRTLTATISGGHITGVTDSANRSVSYSYNDAYGDLTDVLDMNGGHSQFVYNSSHQLLVMVSPRYYSGTAPAPPSSCNSTPPGNVTSNVYDGNGRVVCQWDPDGRQTSFDYTSISGATKVTDPKGNVTVNYFTAGMLTSQTRGYGTSSAATWTFGYDPASGGATSVVDPRGNTSQDFYDSNGDLVTQVDPLGRATTRTYNAFNEVTSVTPPATYGSAGTVTTSYTYDEPAYSSAGTGNLTTVSAPILSSSGASQGTQISHYVYGDNAHPGDVTSMVDPGGNTWAYTYDSFGDKVSETAPATSDNSDGSGSRSNVTKWVYNTGTGWVTQELAPRFALVNPSATTCSTPAVGCTTYTYDNMGRPLTVTDGDGRVTTKHYDPDGNVDFSVDADNNRTSYTHDPAGQLTVTSRPDTTTVKSNYWPDGTVEDQIDAANSDTHYAYDSLGHLTGVTDPNNRVTGYTNDAVGNLLVRSDPGVSGCVTSSTTKGCTIYTYDAANEVTGINYNDPGVTPNITAVSYDGNGRRTSMTEQVHGSTTNTVASTWAYDSLGRTTSATDINSKTSGYTYDNRSNLTSITYPGATGTVNRAFDPAGRVQSISDWLGNTTSYSYDADSNLGARTSPTTGTSVVDTSGYDNAGNLTSISAMQGSTAIDSFAYVIDPNAQETQVTSSGVPADNHTYGYNSLNQLTQIDGGQGYGYDHADNPTGVAGGGTQNFDAANQLSSATPAIKLVSTASGGDSGTSTSVTLNLTGVQANDQILIVSTQASGSSVTGPSGYTQVGTFGSGSAVTTIWRKTAAGTETSAQLGYSLGQAKSITAAIYRGVDPTSPIDTTSTNSADTSTSITIPSLTTTKAGERLLAVLGATSNVTPTTWTPPAGMTSEVSSSSQTLSSETLADQTLYATGATGTRAATFGTVPANLVGTLLALKPATYTYGYDTRGDRTSVTTPLGTTTLGYDQARRLTSYGPNTTYTYNGDGLRMTKVTGSTTENYTYDHAGHILVDGSTNFIYGPDGLPLEQLNGSTVIWYHHDRLGSTRALTNNSGAVVGAFTYDPYGNATASSGTTTTPIGYAGAYTDAESGFTYLINRYYDPPTGQFLTVDPLDALTATAYGYVGNNPLNGTDPNGMFCFSCAAAGFVGAVDDFTGGATRNLRQDLGIDNNVESHPGYQGGFNFMSGGPVDPCSPFTFQIGEVVPPGDPEAGALGDAASGEVAGAMVQSPTVADVLKGKLGSIYRAPLPPGTPSLSEVQNMTMKEIQAAAKAREPGYQTLWKLLNDNRFNKKK